jgi:hypothetical protein
MAECQFINGWLTDSSLELRHETVLDIMRANAFYTGRYPAVLQRVGKRVPFVDRTITWEFGHFLGYQQVSKERYGRLPELQLQTS